MKILKTNSKRRDKKTRFLSCVGELPVPGLYRAIIAGPTMVDRAARVSAGRAKNDPEGRDSRGPRQLFRPSRRRVRGPAVRGA
jgi:hypothetical protein